MKRAEIIQAKSSHLYIVDFEPAGNISGYKLADKGEQLSEINTANVQGKTGIGAEIKVEYLKTRHLYVLNSSG